MSSSLGEESLSIETKNTIEDVIADLKYNLKGV